MHYAVIIVSYSEICHGGRLVLVEGIFILRYDILIENLYVLVSIGSLMLMDHTHGMQDFMEDDIFIPTTVSLKIQSLSTVFQISKVRITTIVIIGNIDIVLYRRSPFNECQAGCLLNEVDRTFEKISSVLG